MPCSSELLDVPVGHLGRPFVVPADHRLSLRPGLDQFPAGMRALFPQRAIVRPERVLGFCRHRRRHVRGFFLVRIGVESEPFCHGCRLRQVAAGDGHAKRSAERPRGLHVPSNFRLCQGSDGRDGLRGGTLQQNALRRRQRRREISRRSGRVPQPRHDPIGPLGPRQSCRGKNAIDLDFGRGSRFFADFQSFDACGASPKLRGDQSQRQQFSAPANPGPGLDHVAVRFPIGHDRKGNMSRSLGRHEDQLRLAALVDRHPQGHEILLADVRLQPAVDNQRVWHPGVDHQAIFADGSRSAVAGGPAFEIGRLDKLKTGRRGRRPGDGARQRSRRISRGESTRR